jgi:hypothetical protein
MHPVERLGKKYNGLIVFSDGREARTFSLSVLGYNKKGTTHLGFSGGTEARVLI